MITRFQTLVTTTWPDGTSYKSLHYAFGKDIDEASENLRAESENWFTNNFNATMEATDYHFGEFTEVQTLNKETFDALMYHYDALSDLYYNRPSDESFMDDARDLIRRSVWEHVAEDIPTFARLWLSESLVKIDTGDILNFFETEVGSED